LEGVKKTDEKQLEYHWWGGGGKGRDESETKPFLLKNGKKE